MFAFRVSQHLKSIIHVRDHYHELNNISGVMKYLISQIFLILQESLEKALLQKLELWQ